MILLFIISIISFFVCVFMVICSCKIKENLDIKTYTDLYLNAIQKTHDSITVNAVTSCNNIANAIPSIQTNTSTYNTSYSSYNSNFINIKNSIDTLVSTSNTDNSDLNVLNNNLTQIVSNTYNKLLYVINVNKDTYAIYNRLYQENPNNSALNLYLKKDSTELINQYNYGVLTYNTVLDQINKINTYITSITSNLNTLNTFINNITSLKTNLTNLINNINNQINLYNIAVNIAQTAVNNSTNYIQSDIITALGSIYTTAKTNYDNAIISQTNATNALKNNTNPSQTETLTINKNTADENVLQTNQTLRFLLNPSNLTSDINNIKDVIDLNSNIYKTNALNNFFKYFNDNNINFKNSNVFVDLYNNVNKSIVYINNTSTNINSIFQSVVPTVRNMTLNTSQNALNTCKTSNTTLISLLNTSNSTITSLNTLISNANTLYTNTSILKTNLYNNSVNISGQLPTLYEKLRKSGAYNFERFYYPGVYGNDSNSNNGALLRIGTISKAGKLVKFYVYANIYSWQMCIASSTVFKVLINNTSGATVYSKTFNISFSTQMAIENMESISSIPVYNGYTVNIVVQGSSYWYCVVRSSNVQVQLEIDSS